MVAVKTARARDNGLQTSIEQFTSIHKPAIRQADQGSRPEQNNPDKRKFTEVESASEADTAEDGTRSKRARIERQSCDFRERPALRASPISAARTSSRSRKDPRGSPMPLQVRPARAKHRLISSVPPAGTDEHDTVGFESKEVPKPVTMLVTVYESILRALSLHLAHHGLSAPVRLSDLLPSASKIWGARKITLEDLRRCLALLDSIDPPFRLWDYGRAGLCLEMSSSIAAGPAQGRAVLASAIDEAGLSETFADDLSAAYDAFTIGSRSSDEDFMAQMPLVDLPQHPSLIKSRSTSAGLGQQRLDELLRTPRRLKAQNEAAKTSGLLPATPSTTDSKVERLTGASDAGSVTPKQLLTPKTTPKDRKASMYARLAAKVAASASNVAGLSTSTMKDGDGSVSDAAGTLPIHTTTRRAALSHLPTISAILTLLSASAGGRTAFSMPQLVRKITESSRAVIEERVVRDALVLLGGAMPSASKTVMPEHDSAEHRWDGLAPEFVRIVRIGEGVVGVVVNAKLKPADLDHRIEMAKRGEW